MAHIAAHLNAELILMVTVVAVRYKLPLPSYCRCHFCEPDIKTRLTTSGPPLQFGYVRSHTLTPKPLCVFSWSSTGRTSDAASRSTTARGQATCRRWTSRRCCASARSPCQRRTCTTSSPSLTPTWAATSPTRSSLMACCAPAEDSRPLACAPYAWWVSFIFVHV